MSNCTFCLAGEEPAAAAGYIADLMEHHCGRGCIRYSAVEGDRFNINHFGKEVED
jgi:hypothetical protein